MVSDSVAERQYIDLLVAKSACSKRLEMTLTALPFKQWQSCEEKRSICQDDQKRIFTKLAGILRAY
ncbi:MAG: hypothetical protein PF439_06865 [Helicobacteraceae bacterium]|jgi:hypothetical protein|nr:hypothetical protein [Helicobacteraceae bacterium]